MHPLLRDAGLALAQRALQREDPFLRVLVLVRVCGTRSCWPHLLHRTRFGEKALRYGDIAIILRGLFDFPEDEAIGRYGPLGLVHDVLSSAASFDYLWPR